MWFKREDGTEVVNTEKLEGRMTDSQRNYFAKKFAANAQSIADRRGYGYGEVQYYINEDCYDLVESDRATQGEASDIASRADEILQLAGDNDMTINAQYSSLLEEERRIDNDTNSSEHVRGSREG